MSWTGHDRRFHLLVGAVRDRSKGGVEVLVREPVVVGRSVLLEFESGESRWGEVRHCRPVELMHHAGVALESSVLEFSDD